MMQKVPLVFQINPDILDFGATLYYLCGCLPFTVSVPKPYVLGSETVRSWYENRTVLGRKP